MLCVLDINVTFSIFCIVCARNPLGFVFPRSLNLCIVGLYYYQTVSCGLRTLKIQKARAACGFEFAGR